MNRRRLALLALLLLPASARAQAPAPAEAAPPAAEDDLDLAAAIADGPALSPAEAAARAVERSPDLARARALSRASEAAVSRARAAMLPRLDLSVSYQHVDGFPDGQIDLGADPDALAAARQLAQNISDPAARTLWLGQLESQSGGATIVIPRDRFAMGARLTWPVSDMFFAILPAVDAAEAGGRARAHQEAATAAGVRRSALEAYYQLARARGALAVSEEALRQAEGQRAQVEAAARAGFLTAADVAAVEARVAEVRGAIASARAGVAIADAGLRALLDAEPGPVFGVSLQADADLGGATTDEEAIARRPELLAVRESLGAQRAAARAEDARGYPHLSLYASADLANPNRYQIPPRQEFQGSWELGAMLTWSPNDLLGAVHRGEELGGEQAATEAQLEALARMVRVELAQARAQREAARERVEAQAVHVRASEAAYASRLAQLRAGEATVADVLASESQLYRARLARLDAEVALQIAGVRLAHAGGAL